MRNELTGQAARNRIRGNEAMAKTSRQSWALRVILSIVGALMLCYYPPTARCASDLASTSNPVRSSSLEDLEGLLKNCFPFGGDQGAAKKLRGILVNADAAKGVRLAAQDGNGVALMLMGWIQANGWGVPPNSQAAMECFRKAAETGYPLAQAYAGCAYVNGRGGPQQVQKGLDWIRRAAAQGVALAEADLGIVHLEGILGVPRDTEKGIAWIRKSVDQQNPHGKYALGVAYYEGTGLSKNILKALDLLREASEQGHPYAQLRLADHYGKLPATPENRQTAQKYRAQAVKWLRDAAQRGDESARKSLEGLETGN